VRCYVLIHPEIAMTAGHQAIAAASFSLVLVRCEDQATPQLVVTAAADRARVSWDGSLTEFLAALDPVAKMTGVRTAVGKPSRPNG